MIENGKEEELKVEGLDIVPHVVDLSQSTYLNHVMVMTHE